MGFVDKWLSRMKGQWFFEVWHKLSNMSKKDGFLFGGPLDEYTSPKKFRGGGGGKGFNICLFTCQHVLNEFGSQWTDIGCSSFKIKHHLQVCTTSGKSKFEGAPTIFSSKEHDVLEGKKNRRLCQ
jgi:hypothetical protein